MAATDRVEFSDLASPGVYFIDFARALIATFLRQATALL